MHEYGYAPWGSWPRTGRLSYRRQAQRAQKRNKRGETMYELDSVPLHWPA
jgi:hypothetical protein